MERVPSRIGYRQWCMAVLFTALAACGGQDPILGSGDVAPVVPPTPVAPITGPAPTVTAVAPLDRSTGVPTNVRIVTAAFSTAMDATTLTATSFTLACPAASPITGVVGYQSATNVATLTLPTTTLLPANTACSATITTAARSAAGVPFATNFVWTFTTGATPDSTAPTVSSTVPLSNAIGIPLNTRIVASFSEPMDPLSISIGTMGLSCPAATGIPGSVTYAVSGNAATFTPAANLPAGTLCTMTLTTGVRDLAGNAMAAPYAWTFTTGAAPDTTAPTVSSTVPAAAAVGVATNSRLTATFSEPMDPLTITTATFGLSCPASTVIVGTVGYAVSGNVATFTPTANLPAGTVCRATITTGARDGAGNALAAPVTWTFTTASAPDTTPPTVSSTVPAVGATGVALNSRLTATFSEPMDPLSITTASFAVSCPVGAPVTGTVGYAATGNVATFTPTANLPGATVCTATLGTGIRDAAGNALTAPFVWTFTTGAAPDTTAPTVSSTVPAAGATGVTLNSSLTATFSEPMDPLTITAATFGLTCPASTPISGTVAYAVNGNVATFTPGATLPPSTLCTATITTGARDSAGNALVAPVTWTFTTGATPDTTAPVVTFTNPADGAVGVCVNKTINATFSEALDPLTITSATFTVVQSASGVVTGVVAYDGSTNIASFRPVSNLVGTPATTYIARLQGGASGVKDLAGNPLAADRIWSFTTNASVCAQAPVLGAAASFGAYGGTATLTNDGLATVIDGDIGVGAASTTITGLRDSGGNVYTITPNNNGFVNGLIYSLTAPPGSPPGVVVAQARGDALVAFNSISPLLLPGGIDPSNLAQCPSCGGAGGGPDELAGRTLPPGIYRSAPGNFDIGGAGRTTANLTLDAGGDPNAVWIFQTAAGTGTLNVGLVGPSTPAVPIRVLLINGGQAKNVFWYVPGGAVIGTGSTMTGTMLADATITFSTTGGSPPTAPVTTLNGRAIALTAAVTMTNTVINRPAP